MIKTTHLCSDENEHIVELSVHPPSTCLSTSKITKVSSSIFLLDVNFLYALLKRPITLLRYFSDLLLAIAMSVIPYCAFALSAQKRNEAISASTHLCQIYVQIGFGCVPYITQITQRHPFGLFRHKSLYSVCVESVSIYVGIIGPLALLPHLLLTPSA